MGNLNKRLLDKFIEKTGGWENLLHETLKDLYSQLVNKSPNLEDTLEEVGEVLEAYKENLQDIQAAQAGMEKIGFKSVVPPSISEDPILAEMSREVSSKPESNSALMERKPKINLPEGGRREILRVTTKLPLEGPDPEPTWSKVKIVVDSSLGSSSGNILLPAGHKIMNRTQLMITTVSGMLLGQGKEYGQIKGSSSVSGYIKEDGRYDLVFQDTKLGEALIIYQTVKEKKPKVVELKMICSKDKATEEWIGYIRDPEVVVRADTLEEARDQVLGILRDNYSMEIISCALSKRYDDDGQEVRLKQEYPQLDPS